VLIFNKPNSEYSFSINSKSLTFSAVNISIITLSARHPFQCSPVILAKQANKALFALMKKLIVLTLSKPSFLNEPSIRSAG